jgi:hypothetical protein
MLEEALDKDQDRGSYFVDCDQLRTFIGRETTDDFQAGTFGRGTAEDVLKGLMGAGYLSRTVETSTIPDLAGSYSGRLGTNSQYSRLKSMSFTLKWHEGTSQFSGPYRLEDPQVSCWMTGTAIAVAQKQGMVQLDFNQQAAGPDCWLSPVVEDLDVSPQSGRGPRLAGPCPRGPSPTSCDIDLRTSGGAASQLTIRRYTYSFSQGFLKLMSKDGKLRGGPIQADEVRDLLLDPGGASAQGKFAWHANLNEPSKLVAGKPKVEGVGRVAFGKRPDGDWVVTEYGAQ